MSRSRILLTLALAAPLATHPADLVEPLWGSLTAIWAEIGCNIDPHGGCEPGQGEEPAPVPETDIGLGIDPHG